jgi:hypothetical protein
MSTTTSPKLLLLLLLEEDLLHDDTTSPSRKKTTNVENEKLNFARARAYYLTAQAWTGSLLCKNSRFERYEDVQADRGILDGTKM